MNAETGPFLLSCTGEMAKGLPLTTDSHPFQNRQSVRFMGMLKKVGSSVTEFCAAPCQMELKEPMYSPEMMEFFWKYAKHPDFNARCSILRKEGSRLPIPTEILAYLANDVDWYVRMLVAANKRTPIEALKNLIIDSNSQVRRGVLQNPNCIEEIRLLYRANKKYGHLFK